MVGASKGEAPNTNTSSENILELSFIGKKSRTMDMAATHATQPPNACVNRNATNSSTSVLNASNAREHKQYQSNIQRLLPSKSIEQGSIHQLSKGKANKIAGY